MEKTSQSIPKLENIDILVAEDNAINRTIFEKLMAPTMANLFIVKNGAECIELFDIHQPKVIFMDIQMLIMGGIEACKIIREKSNIPIIAITANVKTEDAKEYRKIGFNCVVGKPIKLQELYDACKKYIIK
jgi:CheY-like chemotaxis protein